MKRILIESAFRDVTDVNVFTVLTFCLATCHSNRIFCSLAYFPTKYRILRPQSSYQRPVTSCGGHRWGCRGTIWWEREGGTYRTVPTGNSLPNAWQPLNRKISVYRSGSWIRIISRNFLLWYLNTVLVQIEISVCSKIPPDRNYGWIWRFLKIRTGFRVKISGWLRYSLSIRRKMLRSFIFQLFTLVINQVRIKIFRVTGRRPKSEYLGECVESSDAEVVGSNPTPNRSGIENRYLKLI